MIEKLTVKQEKELPKFRAAALAVGTCTKPANRKRAEAAFAKMYALIGKPKPKVVWVKSPLEAERYINLCKKTPGVYNGTSFWGQQDNYWVAHYEFCRKLGVKYDAEAEKKLKLRHEDVHSCNWWYPFEKAVIAVDRPRVCKLENGVIHSENGRAVEYRDGWGIYALHGVVVPAWVVEKGPEDITASEVLALPNAQQRHEAILKVGVERLKKELKAKVLDTKSREYELFTIEVEGRRIGPYLELIDQHTGKHYCEGVGTASGAVDASITTWQQAIAWKWGDGTFEPRKYQGDIVLKPTTKPAVKPTQTALDRAGVLAKGAATGHTHAFRQKQSVRVFHAGEQHFVEVKRAATLVHPEHADERVVPGVYQVVVAKETDHIAQVTRNVAD
jgi:hypothetical protein